MSDIPTTTARLVLDVGDAEQTIEGLGEAVDQTAESFESMAEGQISANDAVAEGLLVAQEAIDQQAQLVEGGQGIADAFAEIVETYAQGGITATEALVAGEQLAANAADLAEAQGQVVNAQGQVTESTDLTYTSLQRFNTGITNTSQLVGILPSQFDQLGSGLGSVAGASVNATQAMSGLATALGTSLSPAVLGAGAAIAAGLVVWDLWNDTSLEVQETVPNLVNQFTELGDAIDRLPTEAQFGIDRLFDFDEKFISDVTQLTTLITEFGVSAAELEDVLTTGPTATKAFLDELEALEGFDPFFERNRSQLQDLVGVREELVAQSRATSAAIRVENALFIASNEFLAEQNKTTDLYNETRNRLRDTVPYEDALLGLGPLGEPSELEIRNALLEQAAQLEEEAAAALAARAEAEEEGNLSLSDSIAFGFEMQDLAKDLTLEYEAQQEELTGLALAQEQSATAQAFLSEAFSDGTFSLNEVAKAAALTGLSVEQLFGIFDENRSKVEEFNAAVTASGVAFRDDLLPTIDGAIGAVQAALEDEDPIDFESILFAEGVELGETGRLADRLEQLVAGEYDALAQRLISAPPEAQQQLLDQLDLSNILDIEQLETTAETLDADRVAAGLGLQTLGEELSVTISDQINTMEDAFTPDFAKEARDEVEKLSTQFSSWQAWTTAVSQARTEGREVGEAVGDGMAAGISASEDDVVAAAAALGAAAQAALDASLQISSPSQTAAETGRNFTAGFIQGASEGDTINVNVTAPGTSDPQVFGRSVGQAVRSVRRR